MKITRQPHPIQQKQMENVECFKCDKIKSDERCAREIKSRNVMERAVFNKKENVSILSFRRVLYVVCFLLGIFPASEV